MIFLIIAVLLTVGISFTCSLMEACLLSMTNADIAKLMEKKPSAGAIWKEFKADIQKPIAVILVLNTFAYTMGAAISGAQFDRLFGSKWIALFSAIFSIVMIQWAEILPKILGIRYNTLLARAGAVPMKLLIKILRPIVTVIVFLNKPFERKSTLQGSPAIEIRMLARYAALESQISSEQARLISGSIDMTTLRARDIMVDRNEVKFINRDLSLYDAFLTAHAQRHTRYPVVKDNNIDDVVGYVNFKDIIGALHMNPSDPTLGGISRPILFVEGDLPLNGLLRDFTRSYQHIAIVKDSAGKTAGLVTLEDVIEILVGDLIDEYDTPPDKIVMMGMGKCRAGGGTTLNALRMRVFPDFPDEPETIDRWVKKASPSGIPIEGSTFSIGKYTLKVRRVTRGNVYDVIITGNEGFT